MKTILVPYRRAEPLPQLADAFPSDDAVIVAKGPAGAMVARLYEQVASRVATATEAVGVVSGDDTSALAVVAGLQRRGIEPGVVWLAARGGLHTARTTPTGDLDGMVLSMLTGRAGASLSDALHLTPIADAACVLAGTRTLDPGERDILDASAMRRCTLEELERAALPTTPWYVHVDAGLLDPAHVPALRRPVAGGASIEEVAVALRTLARRGAVAAFGLACTFLPDGLAQRDALRRLRPLLGAALGWESS